MSASKLAEIAVTTEDEGDAAGANTDADADAGSVLLKAKWRS